MCLYLKSKKELIALVEKMEAEKPSMVTGIKYPKKDEGEKK